MSLKIKCIEYYLPEKVISNNDLALENPDWDVNKIALKTGVLNRHIAESNETAFDLSIKAVQKLFDSGQIKKNDIDGIIFCTQSNDYIMPSNSFLIHKYFKFDERVWSFDYNLACSGYVFGLAISRGFLETKLANNILLITAETYSKYINPKDRSTRVLFGDGCSASIVCNEETNDFFDMILSTSGEKFDTFYIPAGGSRIPASNLTKVNSNDNSGNVRSLEDIYMNGFAVWQFISMKVSEQIISLLEKNDLTINNIDLFIFHQASKLTLDSLIKMLKIENDKVYGNIKNIGNTVSSSIPILLKDALENGKLKSGDLILISGFGVGLSWGSIIMKY